VLERDMISPAAARRRLTSAFALSVVSLLPRAALEIEGHGKLRQIVVGSYYSKRYQSMALRVIVRLILKFCSAQPIDDKSSDVRHRQKKSIKGRHR